MRREDAVDQEAAKAQQRQDYDRLCSTLKGFRDKAIEGRRASGIEGIWLEDDEYYEGIDDANRGEKTLKPTSPDGNVRISKPAAQSATRSTVFVELTRPYVDAASARVSDMLLPTDDRNWALEPTPVPDLIKQLDDKTPIAGQGGQPAMVLDAEAQPPQPGMPVAQPAMRPMTAADEARKVLEEAKASCEKAQKRIDDWLTECDYLDAGRDIIDDAARIGVGILKGPMPKKIRKKAIVRALQGIGLVIQESMNPVSGRISPWNFYPDPNCGEDIQRGKYVFERDDITGRELADLKGLPGYLDYAIDEAMEEGPVNTVIQGGRQKTTTDNRNDAELYQIWYFHGYLSADDLDTLGATHGGDGKQYPVICTMVNDKIIKAALTALDSGEFPYDVFVWQKRAGHWAGRGVARQMRTEQDGVNAAVRAMMDNAGLSSGAQVIINRSKIVPANGKWALEPRKVWWTRQDEDIQNVRDAILFVNMPSVQQELMAIIEFWKHAAEDATGLPMLLQGQLGQSPDTVGGMTLLNNNATTVLRRIAKNYDSRITDRHLSRYYEWLLLHGPDDTEKGDFQIKARGSSALLERDAQSQFLMQLLNASLNPRFKLDPAKIMGRVLKSQRFDVEDLELPADEAAKLMQGQPDPRVAVEQMRQQMQEKELQAENERFATQLQADRETEKMELAFRQWEKQIDATLESAKLDGDRAMNIDEIKAAMAQTNARLLTQMRLAMRPQGGPQVATPGMEPRGRAPNGEAFQA